MEINIKGKLQEFNVFRVLIEMNINNTHSQAVYNLYSEYFIQNLLSVRFVIWL